MNLPDSDELHGAVQQEAEERHKRPASGRSAGHPEGRVPDITVAEGQSVARPADDRGVPARQKLPRPPTTLCHVSSCENKFNCKKLIFF